MVEDGRVGRRRTSSDFGFPGNGIARPRLHNGRCEFFGAIVKPAPGLLPAAQAQPPLRRATESVLVDDVGSRFALRSIALHKNRSAAYRPSGRLLT